MPPRKICEKRTKKEKEKQKGKQVNKGKLHYIKVYVYM
jgi:hypothetical protein